ncbi:MAG: hypothetical protein VB142_01395 [Burkholderia sp.]
MMDTTLASIFAGVYDGHAEALTAVSSIAPNPVSLVPHQLDTIGPTVAESVHHSPERVELHRLLDQHRQPVDALAEIDCIPMQVHLHFVVEAEHAVLSNEFIIAVSRSTSALVRKNSTLTPLGRCAHNSA